MGDFWFGLAGEVLFAEVLITPTGQSKGCGCAFLPHFLVKELTFCSPRLVEFATQEEAKTAIANLSESQLLGRPIFIREVRLPFPLLSIPTKSGTQLIHITGP